LGHTHTHTHTHTLHSSLDTCSPDESLLYISLLSCLEAVQRVCVCVCVWCVHRNRQEPPRDWGNALLLTKWSEREMERERWSERDGERERCRVGEGGVAVCYPLMCEGIWHWLGFRQVQELILA